MLDNTVHNRLKRNAKRARERYLADVGHDGIEGGAKLAGFAVDRERS